MTLEDFLAVLLPNSGMTPAAAAAAALVTGQAESQLQPATAPPTIPPVEQPAASPLPGLEAALRAVSPNLSNADVVAWVAVMSGPLQQAGITSAHNIAAFVGQCAVESGGFRVLEENLNYSAPRICQVWPKRFPTVDVATPCAHNPQALANTIYANRIGNRDTESGDGWRFRGRGLIQITGRANYEQFAHAQRCTIDQAVDLAATHAGAVLSATWFWTGRGLVPLADAWAIDTITARINAGMAGAQERRRLCEAALSAIGV